MKQIRFALKCVGQCHTLASIRHKSIRNGKQRQTKAKPTTRGRIISQNIYLTIRGTIQGVFPGEERDGAIECLHFEHAIEAPRDPMTGVAGIGSRHKPVLIRKMVDSTSPLFNQALYAAEKLETVTFRFVSVSHTAGTLPPIYFVRLSDASVASVKQYFFNAPSGVFVGWQLLEEITFYYLKIEWGFNDHVQARNYWINAG